MQNLNYNSVQKNYLGIKLLRSINNSLSFMITILSIIGFIEFVRFCFDLYTYLH